MIPPLGIPFYGIVAGKLRRYLSIKNFFDLFLIPLGIIQSILHILRIQPDVVFSKGGYVSLHVVVAAWILRKRIIIHESDVLPGLTTKLCAPMASTICVSWERTEKLFSKYPVVRTGIPVREELSLGKSTLGRDFANIEENQLPTLLIVGGSLGAGSINSFIRNHLGQLLREFNVVHIVGKGKYETLTLPAELKKRYAQFEFVGEEIAHLFALSSVIIARAGSTFLAECASLGKPLIMIPLPLSQSRGDQFDNAKEYIKIFPENSTTIDEEQLSYPLLVEAVEKILHTHTTAALSSSSERIIELFGI